MTEFTIDIQTTPGEQVDSDLLVDLTEALRAWPGPHGAVAGLQLLGAVVTTNTETGQIGALFQVDADGIAEAVSVGVRGFNAALEQVGIPMRAARLLVDEPVAA